MILSCDDTRYGISSGEDWTKLVTTRMPGFSTYKGLYFGKDRSRLGKLTGFSITGQSLPNFDIQVSQDGRVWSSLMEGHFDKSDMDQYTCVFEDMPLSFAGYRVLVTSRDPWTVSACDFTFESQE